MGELRRYRKKATSRVTAVQLDLDTAGFTYRKWGAPQCCKPGDWIVNNGGDVYSIDQRTFEQTYRKVEPGRYSKVIVVFADVAGSAGVIRTKEGETRYEAGDYLVYNAADRRDGYAVNAQKFLDLYEPVEVEAPGSEGTQTTSQSSDAGGHLRNARDNHLFGPGAKRILALDGGGIRGILTLQILRRIEGLVRARTGRSDAVLSDYFDLVGGTSTGAIIAAAVALGWTVDRIDGLYQELGKSIFERSIFRRWGFLWPKFRAKPLREALEREFKSIRLGDPDELKTGLAIVAKRLDTGSPWVVHNNPRGKYFDKQPGGIAEPNRHYLLREVVRASTAAPTYFEPESIRVAEGVAGAFVDGGVSPHNNPSLQLLMLATLKGHALEWPLGAKQLQLVSIGTGRKGLSLSTQEVTDMKPLELGVRGLTSLMDDASALNEQVLQWLSRSPTARRIDSEAGDLAHDVFGGGNPWLTYLRYDAELDSTWLQRELGLSFDPKELLSVHEMDKPENMKTLARIGEAAAERLVHECHFDREFDI